MRKMIMFFDWSVLGAWLLIIGVILIAVKSLFWEV